MPTAELTSPRTVRCDGFQTRAAVLPTSIEKADRRFVVTASTGARMLRFPIYGDPFEEELEISEQAIRMGRVNAGTGLLLYHERFRPEGHIGTTERGWIEKAGTNGGGDVRIRCRLSKRPDVEGFWIDLQDGILRSNSIGYRVHRYLDVTKPDDPVRVLRAVDWEIMEVTFCSVPEDAGGSIRGARSAESTWEATIEAGNPPGSGDRTMPQNEGTTVATATPTAPATETRCAAPAPEVPIAAVATAQPPAAPVTSPAPTEAARTVAPTDPLEGARQAAAIAERERGTLILRSAEAAGAPVDVARDLVARGVTVEDARAELGRRFATGGGPDTRSQVHVLRDERENFRGAAGDALLTRFDPTRFPMSERGRRWQGSSLLDLARECCRLNGYAPEGRSRMEIAGRAMATSDFPALLENIATKTLRQQYDAIPQQWRNTICRVGTAPDFKTFTRVQLSGAPTLLKVEEGAQIQHGSMSDAKQGYALATYARKVVLTRRAIVNDDLQGFVRIPQLFGASARRLEDGLVYGVLTANALLADGVALFAAAAYPTGHQNTGVKTLTNDGLTEGRTKMRLQKGLASEELNLGPAYLIVPAALETAAKQLVSNEWNPQVPGTVNTFKGLQVIVHSLFDASSAIIWYLAAAIDQIDVLEIFYLEGENGPVMEEMRDPDIDGYCWNIRLDVVAGATDHRGLFRSAGTTP